MKSQGISFQTKSGYVHFYRKKIYNYLLLYDGFILGGVISDLTLAYLRALVKSVRGCVAQSVTCLATDANLTADPGVASLNPARSHTFVEIDHEIIATVILLPSAESFMKGCC